MTYQRNPSEQAKQPALRRNRPTEQGARSSDAPNPPQPGSNLSKVDKSFVAGQVHKTPMGQLTEHRLATLKRLIEESHDTIVKSDRVNRIPESVFKNEMLPFMFDEIPDFAKNDPTLQMTSAKWIAAAGGPHAEFDVISDETGEVLFRCPAYFARDIYDRSAGESRGRLNSVFAHAKQVSHMSPIRAQHFTAEQFTGRGVSMNRDKVIESVQSRWNEIFVRYGRPTLSFDKEGMHPTLNKESASSSTGALGAQEQESQEYQNDGFDC